MQVQPVWFANKATETPTARSPRTKRINTLFPNLSALSHSYCAFSEERLEQMTLVVPSNLVFCDWFYNWNWKFFRSITALKLGLYCDWDKRISCHLLISNTWSQLKKLTLLLKPQVPLKKWAMTANAFLGSFEPILHGLVNSESNSPKIW